MDIVLNSLVRSGLTDTAVGPVLMDFVWNVQALVVIHNIEVAVE